MHTPRAAALQRHCARTFSWEYDAFLPYVQYRAAHIMLIPPGMGEKISIYLTFCAAQYARYADQNKGINKKNK